MFLICSIFAIFSRKNWTAAEIISEGASKLLLPCRGQLFPKDSFIWRKYSFSINFCFQPIKLRFSAKSFQQICQKCLVWCQRNTPRKNRFTEKLTFSFKIFRFLTQKKPRLQQKSFGMAVKVAFFVSIKYFHVKSIDKINTNLSIIVRLEQKLFSSLATYSGILVNAAFLLSSKHFEEKLSLWKRIHFCPSYGALSGKKIWVYRIHFSIVVTFAFLVSSKHFE